MPLSKRSKLISATVTVVSLLLLIGIYLLTSDWVIVILFIPPITHWMLQKREEEKE